MTLSFAFGCACGAVASFVLVALAYRAVLRGVMSEQQDRVAALIANRDMWMAECQQWREKHNERALRSGRGPYYAAVDAKGGKRAN